MRYRIIQQISHSSSGISYQAEDLKLKRQVLLKLIHPWSPLPDAARRQFFRYMQEISSIRHPNIAEILNYGELNGQLFIARAFLTHGSLLHEVGRQRFHAPMAIPEALHHTVHLGQILFYLHQQGYCHGAVTLSNILLQPTANSITNDVQLYLADTGLTHLIQHIGHPPISQPIITAAPEQIAGHLSPQSDQYALAVLLYLWLTGRPPFIGTPEEVKSLKLAHSFAAPSTYNTLVSSSLGQCLRKALNPQEKDRYPSIIEFLQSLQSSIEIPKSTSFAQTHDIQPMAQVDIPSLLQTSHTHGIEQIQQETPETEEQQPVSSEDILHAQLVIQSPYTATPQYITLEKSETTVGRAGSSDIFLDHDPLTSRHHALIIQEQDHYFILDQHSLHGTTVNDQRISTDTRYPLQHNDQITIGEYSMRFLCPAQAGANKASQPLPSQLLIHAE
ncbi:MAG TPA: FHA domain-containing serine/threonine-protein kinase [Dictyobacter sp.]|nr:FHA domain-containing serine/threonine-protein kinase [Dictyobacter sp.]